MRAAVVPRRPTRGQPPAALVGRPERHQLGGRQAAVAGVQRPPSRRHRLVVRVHFARLLSAAAQSAVAPAAAAEDDGDDDDDDEDDESDEDADDERQRQLAGARVVQQADVRVQAAQLHL